MSAEIFAKVQSVIDEIKNEQPNSKETLELFRQKYIGSKNILKPLFSEIGKIEPAQKKDFGALINVAKDLAQTKFDEVNTQLENTIEKVNLDNFDLTRPADSIALGSRHPISPRWLASRRRRAKRRWVRRAASLRALAPFIPRARAQTSVSSTASATRARHRRFRRSRPRVEPPCSAPCMSRR